MEAGYDVRTLQELPPLRFLNICIMMRGGVGHEDLNTTIPT